MNNFSVKIANNTFFDFTEIYVSKSIERMAGIALFKTANIYLASDSRYNIYFEDSFEAYIGKTKFISGEVEIINSKYSQAENFIQVGGRDNTSALVDNTWENTTNEWKRQTIKGIVTTLCRAFGISIVTDSSASSAASKRIESFKINEGERIFDAVKRLCVENQILPVSYGDGKLTLTGVAANRVNYESLGTGKYNLLGGETNQSNINRYNQYIVKGYGKETAFKDTTSYIQPYGIATDSVITDTNRKLVHLSETEIDFGSAKDQATYLKNLRAGFSRAYTYKVKDWAQSNKTGIWKINSTVPVDDKILKLKKKMLIVRADYKYDKIDGYTTTLFLVDPKTFTTSTKPIKSGYDR